MYFGEYHFDSFQNHFFKVWNCFERPSRIFPDGSVEGPQTANLDCTVLHPNCNLCNPIAIFFNRIYTATLRKSCSIFSQFTWFSLKFGLSEKYITICAFFLMLRTYLQTMKNKFCVHASQKVRTLMSCETYFNFSATFYFTTFCNIYVNLLLHTYVGMFFIFSCICISLLTDTFSWQFGLFFFVSYTPLFTSWCQFPINFCSWHSQNNYKWHLKTSQRV